MAISFPPNPVENQIHEHGDYAWESIGGKWVPISAEKSDKTTMIASGGIPVGTAVILNSDGTVKIPSGGLSGISSIYNTLNCHANYKVLSCVNENTGFVHLVYNTANSKTMVSNCIVEDDRLVVVSSVEIIGAIRSNIAIAPNGYTGFVVLAKNLAILNIVKIDVDINTGAITGFAPEQEIVNGLSTTIHAMCCYFEYNFGKVIIAYSVAANSGIIRALIDNGLGGFTVGVATSFTSVAYTTIDLFWHTVINKAVCMLYNSGQASFSIISVDGDANVTIGNFTLISSFYSTSAAGSNTINVGYSITMDRVKPRFAFAYCTAAVTTSNTVRLMIANIENDNFLLSGIYTFLPAATNGQLCLTFDKTKPNYLYYYSVLGSSTSFLDELRIKVEDLNLTLENTTQLTYNGGPLIIDAGNATQLVCFDVPTGYFFGYYTSTLTPTYRLRKITNRGPSDLTQDNLVGISQSPGVNGQQLKVATIGQIAEGLTGIVPGVKYYAQPYGNISSISTTSSVYIGKGISSTKLLVKE